MLSPETTCTSMRFEGIHLMILELLQLRSSEFGMKMISFMPFSLIRKTIMFEVY